MAQRQVSLVTGGSRGIGRAICERLARDGFSIHLVYREQEAAARAAQRAIEASGGQVRLHKADVANQHEVEDLVAEVAAAEERLDVLVNNAAVIDDQLLPLTSPETWQRILAINLTAPFLLMREILPLMLDQGSGRIINISSASAQRPAPGQSAYAASKGGLEALTRAVAAEVGHKGIRVNAVSPGFVATDMTAALRQRLPERSDRPWGNPEHIAGVVAFLASEDSSYLQGQVIVADAGRGVGRRVER